MARHIASSSKDRSRHGRLVVEFGPPRAPPPIIPILALAPFALSLALADEAQKRRLAVGTTLAAMRWDSDNSRTSVPLPRKRYTLSDCAVRLVEDAASAAREVAAHGTDPLPSLATQLIGVAENARAG